MSRQHAALRPTRWVIVAVFTLLVLGAGFGGVARYVSIEDRFLHVGAWMLLGFAIRAAVATSRRDLGALRITLGSIAIACMLGALDELAQSWAPLRTSDWGDLLADAVGGTLGALLHFGTARLLSAVTRRLSPSK